MNFNNSNDLKIIIPELHKLFFFSSLLASVNSIIFSTFLFIFKITLPYCFGSFGFMVRTHISDLFINFFCSFFNVANFIKGVSPYNTNTLLTSFL